MVTDTRQFDAFATLHRLGEPLILFNAWDAGSAAAIAKGGARAIATGSWSVAAANGYPDGEGLPLELALANAARIVAAVDLPVTIDFEAGYADDERALADNLARLAATGAVGCNFEDGLTDGSDVRGIDEQAGRIAAARRGAGDAFFINARTDLFLQNQTHDRALADAAIARGQAYAAAGANGFFVPGLVDLDLLTDVCRQVSLPVNAMTWPGAPSNADFAAAGVKRISHGPLPYRQALAAIEEAARAAHGG